MLGLRREAVLDEYTEHAIAEHAWAHRYGDEPADAEGQRACADCAEFVRRLKESEEWT
jgi:hypothetical protein